MKLTNGSFHYVDVDGTLFRRDMIQKIEIEEDDDGVERLVVSTGFSSRHIYGKSKIRKFLNENFPKNSINEICIK